MDMPYFCSYVVSMYHQAAAEGDVDTVRRLLEDGVDPSSEVRVFHQFIIIQ